MIRSLSLLVSVLSVFVVTGVRKRSTGTTDVELNTTQKYRCPSPYVSTKCVKSNWIEWKNHRGRFQNACNGNLVRWGQDSGVQDCGRVCFSCSYIRACCDDCRTVRKVTGKWALWGCTDIAKKYSVEIGLVVEETSTWSRTNSWSESVSTEAKNEASVEIAGHGGAGSSMTLSQQSSRSFEQSFSHSWKITQSSKETRQWTQPAGTCGWVWESIIETTCGSFAAVSRTYQSTPVSEPPCCLPLMNATADPYGECIANRGGEVINLCKGTVTKP